MGLTMRRVLKPLWFLLAVVFLVEAWLWDHLRAAIAWVVDVTKPKLLQIAWFRWLYELMLVWLAKAHAITDPIRRRIKEWLAALRHRARRWLWLLKPGRPSRFMRRLARIRRRVQTQPAG